MPTLSEIQMLSGVPSGKLKLLERFGLEFEDDGFEIDAHHRKAIYDLRNKRLSPYLIAYALRCRENFHNDNFDRYDNLSYLSRLKSIDLSDALNDICPKRILTDTLAAAKFWLDRACEPKPDQNALKRLASWAKAVIAGSPFSIDHTYLAIRLLQSLPYEVMVDYPRPIQKALNRVRHYGHLDGWFRIDKPRGGDAKTVYFAAKFDL